MNKTLLLLLLFVIGFTSCKDSKKEIDELEIAKRYYEALSTSDTVEIASLLTDSLLTKETEYDYEQTFTKKEYVEWLKWDAVFEPTYKVLHIEQENETVKVKISKVDKRVLFLHEGPIVTNQVVRFDANKIISIETTKYEVFNDSIFSKNRGELLSWVDENHPDLKGFIHDQTEAGAQKYMEVIQLYQNREDKP
nr:hypothetical protein [uncultured Allomuricauda sp.]